MTKLVQYLYALIFKNFGTTIAGIVIGIIALYIPVTPELQKILFTLFVTIGALLPHPSNAGTFPGSLVMIMAVLMCFLIASCSLVKNIVTPGLCDTAAVTAAETVKQAVLLLCQKSNPDVPVSKLSPFYYGKSDTVMTINGSKVTFQIRGNLVFYQIDNGYSGTYGTQ